ncbi:MAG: competence protein CoiA family protein [Rhodoglobus sp.]
MASNARVNDIDVVAATVPLSEWIELQRRVQTGIASVIMPFCLCRGHLATSAVGTQFFRHYAGQSDCEYATAGESDGHLFAKNQAAAGAIDAGWSATVEAASYARAANSWRADVLAEHKGRRIALEIQHSQQSAGQYLRRHERYKATNVDSLWFMNRDESGQKRLNGMVRAFSIVIGFDHVHVVGLGSDGDLEIPLREFVAGWLSGRRPALPPMEQPEPEPEPEPEVAMALSPVQARILRWVDTRGPSPLPQSECPDGCDPGMSYSAIMETWVCMSCRRTRR